MNLNGLEKCLAHERGSYGYYCLFSGDLASHQGQLKTWRKHPPTSGRPLTLPALPPMESTPHSLRAKLVQKNPHELYVYSAHTFSEHCDLPVSAKRLLALLPHFSSSGGLLVNPDGTPSSYRVLPAYLRYPTTGAAPPRSQTTGEPSERNPLKIHG